MSLMATLPNGCFAVSIPHEGEPNRGFPIRKSATGTMEEWVLAYALQSDRRYQAIEILFQGRRFGMDTFQRYARRWVEDHAGRMHIIKGRYAYDAPTRELWNVILRDSGYMALDPSGTPTAITPELIERRKDPLSSGVVVRIALHAWDRLPPRATLPVFSQVEMTPDPQPEPRSRWISFDAYRKDREVQSQPPAPLIPDFIAWLKRLEDESGFESFILRTGMFFGDGIEWWGDRNRRRTQHEGLDFAEGRQANGDIRSIPEGTPVRAISDGEAATVLDDFLGKTVVVRHPAVPHRDGKIFHTLYSHIQPETGIARPVGKGCLLGRVVKQTTAGAPAHLHLTAAWIPGSIRPGEMTLEQITSSNASVVLTDFSSVIRGKIRDSSLGIRV